MRKYQQKLLFDILKMCEDKHGKMKSLTIHSYDQIITEIRICREYAEQSIEYIEELCGQGLYTVQLLFEYCELLNRMSRERKVNVKLLNKQILKVYNNVKYEIEADKIEIAFFPYKSSMSDSLESIYLCAKEDKKCNAYWIPVPYYDKNQNGTLGRMHYEGEAYPDNIEVTDWNLYDTETRHPDIIFTHNPYDRFNLVTSIHPRYYTDVLKQQTDFLVYIDYGIPYWLSPRSNLHTIIDKSTMFPSMLNCNLYVAYSQEMAETCRFALLHSKTVKGVYSADAVNKKVIPLGSPKFDKVLNRSRENYVLPDDWKAIIGDRKVLLFNTTLAELLNNNEGFLETIKKTVEILYTHNDIILWWRPHPLIQGTLDRMRSGLLEEYQRMIDDFKNSGRGIYDDTDDLHRAIAFSDGCYTNESSVMFLYLATGKPFTISAIHKKLTDPYHSSEVTFTQPLKHRINNMKSAKGANIGNWKLCIWWHNFLDEDILHKIHYDNFLDCFIHYIVHMDEYPESEEYRKLQLQMFHDFVENSDGTAGQKIYEYCKKTILEDNM